GPRRTAAADPVMMLFSDGETDETWHAVSEAASDAISAAVSAKAKGVRIIVVGVFSDPDFSSSTTAASLARRFLQTLASSAGDYFELTSKYEGDVAPAEDISVFAKISESLCSQ